MLVPSKSCAVHFLCPITVIASQSMRAVNMGSWKLYLIAFRLKKMPFCLLFFVLITHAKSKSEFLNDESDEHFLCNHPRSLYC